MQRHIVPDNSGKPTRSISGRKNKKWVVNDTNFITYTKTGRIAKRPAKIESYDWIDAIARPEKPFNLLAPRKSPNRSKKVAKVIPLYNPRKIAA